MAAHAARIYVEITIRGTLDRLWELTQVPSLHERWDVRFTEICYLPRPDPAEPQRFRYATRIGFGLRIRGEGESTGEHDGDRGERTSALRFWSNDALSLIQEGSGYWKYVPIEGAPGEIRFFTDYDYRVRFGLAGRVIDRLIFRPLMGWATAWSFDRLRLWIERSIDPGVSMQRSITHAIARVALALIWIYQGLIPKLVALHADELALLSGAGASGDTARLLCRVFGIVEVVLGLIILVRWRTRWPVWLTLGAMPLALLAVAGQSPGYLAGAFNPVSLNLGVFALALITLVMGKDLPTAARCLRRPSRSTP